MIAMPFKFSVSSTVYARFPGIPPSAIRRIAFNVFEPAELCQLSAEKCRLDSFDALVKALLLYFNILSELVAQSLDASVLRTLANGAFVYLDRLLDHNRSHPWPEAWSYHLHFHEQRCQEMAEGDFTGWSNPREGQYLLVSRASIPSRWQSKLPPEILQIIFDRTIIPDVLLDHSITTSPDSVWNRNLRTKKNILLVNKAWYACGVRYLYQHISIHRMPQLFAFTTMLGSLDTPSHLGSLVNTFTVSCFVAADDTHIFQQLLIKTFGLCKNLRKLIFSSRFDKLPICSALHHLRPTVSQLYLDSPEIISYSILSSILKHLGLHLAVLFVRLNPFKNAEINSLIQLHNLHTLICHIDHPQQLSVIAQRWTMPSLTTLTIALTDRFGSPLSASSQSGIIMPFFVAHGRLLRFLDLATYICRAIDPTSWKDILTSKCPLLEHLVVDDESFRLAGRLDTGHLKWLSLRVSCSHIQSIPPDNSVNEDMEKFYGLLPELVLVRQLWVLPAYLSEWLQVFPPGAGPKGPADYFEVDMYQCKLVHDIGDVYLDFEVEDPFGLEGDSDGGSYVPSADSDLYSDSDSESGRDIDDLLEELESEVYDLSS